VEALARYGTKLRLEPGDYLFEEKSVVDSFYVLLGGEISGSLGSTARRRRRS
jgi:CRP-like cAMP-binding protein